MIKQIIILSIVSITLPIYAYYPNNQYINKNNFNSKLNINQPRIRIDGHRNYNIPRYNYKKHCHQCHHNNSKNFKQNRLSNLEKYVFNKKYNHNSDLERLERLENLTFGSIQNGNLSTRYRNLENAIYSRPKYGTKQSVIGKISNYLMGNATGFTPDINPSYFTPNLNPGITNGFMPFGGYTNNFYPTPGFNNQNYEQYSNGPFGNKGWGVSEQNYGSGSSITILD